MAKKFLSSSNAKKVFYHLFVLSLFALAFVTALLNNHQSYLQERTRSDSFTEITVWNYYNGDQLAAFDELVSRFNHTVGVEEGIFVNTVSHGDIANLADTVINSVEKKTGSKTLPNIVALYPETAYVLEQKNIIKALDDLFTSEELAEYIPEFIDSGRFIENGPLYLFPISKSCEIFACNASDWKTFQDATGISIDDIQCIEDMTAAARSYYEWTDSLTPDIYDDGLSLYGRDSISNYIYIGCAQLGHPISSVDSNGFLSIDLDKAAFRKLWDNYYIPYINGYFGAYTNFRSDDAKTGMILALTSSSSAITYFPTQVTLTDDTTHSIQAVFRKPLNFRDSVEDLYVEQGAGYCIISSSSAKEQASARFLKWITDYNQNIDFSISAGYSPVKNSSNSPEVIQMAFSTRDNSEKNSNILSSLLIASSIFTHDKVYSAKPFNASKDLRSYLENALDSTARTDRAAVIEAVASGQSHAEAVAPYITDNYFDSWFESIENEVDNIVY